MSKDPTLKLRAGWIQALVPVTPGAVPVGWMHALGIPRQGAFPFGVSDFQEIEKILADLKEADKIQYLRWEPEILKAFADLKDLQKQIFQPRPIVVGPNHLTEDPWRLQSYASSQFKNTVTAWHEAEIGRLDQVHFYEDDPPKVIVSCDFSADGAQEFTAHYFRDKQGVLHTMNRPKSLLLNFKKAPRLDTDGGLIVPAEQHEAIDKFGLMKYLRPDFSNWSSLLGKARRMQINQEGVKRRALHRMRRNELAKQSRRQNRARK